ncbi:MAG: FtsQ-type POTRA domain-containing protein [Proteobacteria bacterium]|nr:FtsQ-type POTRA domain-containing protein [Pseudomonadota bacterium]
MSQKIRRQGTSVRKAAAAQGKARQVRAARARTGSALDTALSWLPFSEGQWHRIFLAMILGGAVILAWMVASFAGVPAMAQQQLAAIAHDAGFEVKRVNVTGTKNLNELKVYQLALADNRRAMPMVDIQALRAKLLELSWVQDARVSRQLPDTLAIDIVERKPAAVLRKADRLVLIDATGHELQVVSPERAKGKLVIAGPGAGQQVEALAGLLGAAPALKPQVTEAEWVGNRRWNLTFRTDQMLALPEGDQQAAKALMTFARLDGVNRLLGGKVAAFDMRAPDRIYLRVPGRTDPVEQSVSAARPAAGQEQN